MRVFIILCLMALAAALPGCGVTSHTVATKVTMPPGGCSSGADVTVHSTTDVELARPTCNLASERAGSPQSAPSQAGLTQAGQRECQWLMHRLLINTIGIYILFSVPNFFISRTFQAIFATQNTSE